MSQTPPDSKAIETILEEQVIAWNNGDAEGYARHFSEDGSFTNILGMFFIGHKTFLEKHAQILSGVYHKTVLHHKVVSLKFLHEHTAIVETLVRVTGCTNSGGLPGVHIDEEGRLHTRLLQVMVKEATGWKIVAYHNVDVKTGMALAEANRQIDEP